MTTFRISTFFKKSVHLLNFMSKYTPKSKIENVFEYMSEIIIHLDKDLLNYLLKKNV